jgi:hypothetical protein
MMPSLYFASKSKWHPQWAALRAAGINIKASWLDWRFNHDTSQEPSAGGMGGTFIEVH